MSGAIVIPGPAPDIGCLWCESLDANPCEACREDVCTACVVACQVCGWKVCRRCLSAADIGEYHHERVCDDCIRSDEWERSDPWGDTY